MSKIEFITIPEDFPAVFIDEKHMPDAVAGTIEEGEHRGTYIFSCKARAEEFCWKRGLEFEFVDDDEEAR
jgi:hypothetical protein